MHLKIMIQIYKAKEVQLTYQNLKDPSFFIIAVTTKIKLFLAVELYFLKLLTVLFNLFKLIFYQIKLKMQEYYKPIRLQVRQKFRIVIFLITLLYIWEEPYFLILFQAKFHSFKLTLAPTQLSIMAEQVALLVYIVRSFFNLALFSTILQLYKEELLM